MLGVPPVCYKVTSWVGDTVKTRRALGALLCAVFALQQPAAVWAQDTTPAAQPAEAAQQGIVGLLIDVDGKTPWAGQLVRVVDVETRDLVHQVTTTKDGRFLLPELPVGEYLLTVGQGVWRLPVTLERPVRDLRLVVSEVRLRGERIPMADLRQVEVGTVATVLVIGGVVVGVGGAVAGGVVVAEEEQDRKSDRRKKNNQLIPVSPTSP